MSNNNEFIDFLSLRELFTSDDRYFIPVYQRNYEWQERHISQLLNDVRDYYLEGVDKNYYIGTLIVNRTKNSEYNYNTFETIDGQQRLTTFNIIACALKFSLKNESLFCKEFNSFFKQPILKFESRIFADKTLNQLHQFGRISPDFSNANTKMSESFEIVKRILKSIKYDFKTLQMDRSFSGYLHYLFNSVILTRVQVPQGIDLNHYFEIMNTRGEQLEKHEVLKSRLLSYLSSDEPIIREAFNQIWEACSDIHNYVQTHPNFSTDLRNKIFGKKWFSFRPKNYQSLFLNFKGNNNTEIVISFNDLVHNKIKTSSINYGTKQNQELDERDNDRFHSIINFENFLLHALKTYIADDLIKNISLDDKRLLTNFESYTKDMSIEEKNRFSKKFIFHLLKLRFLFDQYVLKREYANNKDHWCLKMVRYYMKGENGRTNASFNYVNTFNERRVSTLHNIRRSLHDETLILLSMFHVSNPTIIYKNWLFAVLNYLNKAYSYEPLSEEADKPNGIELTDYRDFLRDTAIHFLGYRYLNEQPYEYDDIIISDMNNCAYATNWKNYLRYGNIRNSLVFNYIDYLYWLEQPTKCKDFEFSFRSSVEHFYPQNPMIDKNKIEDKVLDSIGNLCLISASKNSSLSNYMPKAKADHYKDSNSKESIKQLVMLEILTTEEEWNKSQIKDHEKEIFEKIKIALNCI